MYAHIKPVVKNVPETAALLTTVLLTMVISTTNICFLAFSIKNVEIVKVFIVK